PLAVAAALGGELRMEAVIDQGVDVRAGHDDDGPTASAVAAARPAARYALLAAKGQTAPPAIAGCNVDVDFVDEHLLDWLDADAAPVAAVVLELHAACDLREDRMVLAETGVEARREPAALLTDDDRAARDEVPVVRLDAEPLRIAVAA